MDRCGRCRVTISPEQESCHRAHQLGSELQPSDSFGSSLEFLAPPTLLGPASLETPAQGRCCAAAVSTQCHTGCIARNHDSERRPHADIVHVHSGYWWIQTVGEIADVPLTPCVIGIVRLDARNVQETCPVLVNGDLARSASIPLEKHLKLEPLTDGHRWQFFRSIISALHVTEHHCSQPTLAVIDERNIPKVLQGGALLPPLEMK